MGPSGQGSGRLATNRKALRDYTVLERVETGIELQGTEVKSVREGNVNLASGFAKVEGGDVVLYGVHIAPYAQGNRYNPVADRPRKLLLHRKEIAKLTGALSQQGHTLIPLTVYTRKRWIKVELGICRGKQDPDKRAALRRKEADREARRSMARA